MSNRRVERWQCRSHCRHALRITKIGFEAIDVPDEAVAAPTETSRHDAGCLAFAAQDNSEIFLLVLFIADLTHQWLHAS